jgi:hypothetical protein
VPLITRVELKNGTVYELGKVWPVKDKAEGGRGVYRVGLIRLCPAEGEEDEEGSVSLPAHYEIWCVPDSLNDHFFNPVTRALYKTDPRELLVLTENHPLIADALDKHKILRCRNIYLSQVAFDDVDWPTKDGIDEIYATVVEPTFTPDEDEEEEPPAPPNAAQPQVVVPTNGESVEPVA